MEPNLQKNAKEWFYYAQRDLEAAHKLGTEFGAISCFHCQQSAEKYIKGLLSYRQIGFRKSHDLLYLLEQLPMDIPDKVLTRRITLMNMP